MNDDESTNREKIQVISEENVEMETNTCEDASKISLRDSNGSLHSPELEITDQEFNQENYSTAKIENINSDVKMTDNVQNTVSTSNDSVSEESETEDNHSENESEVMKKRVPDAKMMDDSGASHPENTELCDVQDLETSNGEVIKKVDSDGPNQNINMDTEMEASASFVESRVSPEAPVVKSDEVQTLESTLIQSNIPSEDLKTLDETAETNVSSSNEESSIAQTPCQTDKNFEVNNRSDLEVSQETEIMVSDCGQNRLAIAEVAAKLDSSEMVPEMYASVESPEIDSNHDNVETHGAIEVEATVENAASVEVEAKMKTLRVDTKDLGVNSHAKPIGETFEFVAEDINQLIQKSVEIQNDVAKSTKSRRVSTSSSPSVALVDPGCVKEVARSSEKMVAAVVALLDVLQQQLHEMSALTTGYVQMHRDIGFRVTECVDDLLRALYSLISKIEQIDLKMTPLYELGNQVSRLRKSMEQLDKLF